MAIVLNRSVAYEMKIHKIGDLSFEKFEKIKDLRVELVDRALIIHSGNDATFVVFPTGVAVSFTKSDKESEDQ